MTEADLIQFGGWALVVWASGYATGMLFVSVRKMLDSIF